MAWSGMLTENSEIGESITFTPDSPENTPPALDWVNVKSYAGNYSVDSFKAPKRGIYKFTLRGSGGVKAKKYNDPGSNGLYDGEAGGTGGSTTGYLRLEAGQSVYVGAGGVCRAAFVASERGSSLAEISKNSLYFVAGAGGSGGAFYDNRNENGYNCKITAGGNGGGESGAAGAKSMDDGAGGGGTQFGGGEKGTSESDVNKENGSAGEYGVGGQGSSCNDGDHFQYNAFGGRGGDGYYGGGGGSCSASSNGISAASGGGGSGYVKNEKLTVVGKTYTSTTSRGGGALANKAGSVIVEYYARADLPIVFNGTTIERLIFNGVDIQSLIYNGKKLFFERMKRTRRCECAI